MFKKIKAIIRRDSNFMEVIRFGIVGVLSTAITYGVYYLLMHCLNASIAYTLAYIIAFIINFILTTYFTFSVKPTTKRGIGFVVSNVINYLLSVGLLNLFLWIGFSKTWAPIPMFIICIPTNFLIVRWVMKRTDAKKKMIYSPFCAYLYSVTHGKRK